MPAPMAEAARPTLVVGARVADGTGAALADRDVLIEHGRITAVAPRSSIAAHGDWAVIDASGLVVAPGFVDVHSHADLSPLLPSPDTSKILQGVTTEVVGNCGNSPAPLLPATTAASKASAGRLFPSLPTPWQTFGEFLDGVDDAGYVTNYCPLVGHGALRSAVAGVAPRPVTTDETARMQKLLGEAMAHGAFGMSSGLLYPPGVFSDTAELVRLASALEGTGIYATHIRNESGRVMDSLAEAAEIGRRGHCAVEVSHLKTSGRANWGKSQAALAFLDAERDRGTAITQDVYPYAAASTTLTACLPPSMHGHDDESILEQLADQSALAALRRQIEDDEPDDWENLIRDAGYGGIVIASTASHEFEGRSLEQIALDLDVTPFTAFVTVLRAERLDVSMTEFSMFEDDIQTILVNPSTMVGSDGLPAGTGGIPHPRLYGTFPRVLGRYVRDGDVLTLPDAIHRMTALPAEVFHIPDRGRVSPGYVADLVAFDPNTVIDTGTYDVPGQTPAGISWVMQNGITVVEDSTWLGARHGARLEPHC